MTYIGQVIIFLRDHGNKFVGHGALYSPTVEMTIAEIKRPHSPLSMNFLLVTLAYELEKKRTGEKGLNLRNDSVLLSRERFN